MEEMFVKCFTVITATTTNVWHVFFGMRDIEMCMPQAAHVAATKS